MNFSKISILMITMMTLISLKSTNVFSNEEVERETSCKIKLIPKLNAFIFVVGSYKTNWEKQENVTKLSDCVQIAEEALNKANAPREINSIGDFIGAIILAPFEPTYYKGVKLVYTDKYNKKIKLKIKYKEAKK